MKHQKKGRKFNRKRGQRKAFLKALSANLIIRGKIQTTEERAKELKRIAERFITWGKKQNLTGLRMLLKKLPKRAAFKLYYEIAPRYSNRKGGYFRIIKLGTVRRGDGGKKALIEFV